MAICKTEAIVTKSLKLGETSKIVWLYTKDFGKVKVVAKAARAPKNRFGSSLELFTHSAVVFYKKDRRDLQLLSQSDALRHFRAFEADVAKFAFASAVIELLDSMVMGEEPNPGLFQLVLDALARLEACPRSALRTVFWSFELHAADLLGYRPELWKCARCGKEGELPRFAPLKGGLICRACSAKDSDSFEVSPEARDFLRKLQAAPVSESAFDAAGPRLEAEIDRIVEVFLQYHVDRLPGLKSLRLVRNLK
ncbi:MAG: DNA repair protein RecO [Candidatus Eisenbacteria bacterium]|nr:DNA repair protein RecO [Candidatus Eisenbacteria bacterium]